LLVEPPARLRAYRRLLSDTPPLPGTLLGYAQPPSDVARFYAESGALVAWLLEVLERQRSGNELGSSEAALLETLTGAPPGQWWADFGFDSADAMARAWQTWYVQWRPAKPVSLDRLIETRPDDLLASN